MNTISLLKYDKPRILTIDFTQQSVNKFIEAGFNVRRAFSGVLKEDRNMFCIPCSIGDVEIVLFNLRQGSLTNIRNREVHPDSIENDPSCLVVLLEDVWRRTGLSIIFIDHNVDPSDLNDIGVKNFGVANITREFLSLAVIDLLKKMGRMDAGQKPRTVFPTFKGEDFYISNTEIGKVYQKYLQYGEHMIMSADTTYELFGKNHEYPRRCIFHVKDNSSHQYPLCVESTTWDYDRSLLFFPSFGKKTDDVAIELLDDFAREKYDHLFSSPNFAWLEQYLAAPVQNLVDEKNRFILRAVQTVKELDDGIKLTEERFSWMDNLLIAKDTPESEPFKEAVVIALQYLGFKVEDMDSKLTEGEPKREDLRIYDELDEYFAIGEAKTTDAGAKEQMYRDLQKHIMRFMRETGNVTVGGLLFVNHSIKLDPKNRHAFYKSQHVQEELKEYGCSAIDSSFLHDLCQKVLRQEITPMDAREKLKSGKEVMTL